MISVIIPVYNEEEILSKNSLRFKELSQHTELIFVDASSSDSSVEIAKQYGRVVSCIKGRARQMNYGASLARGDILLFLPADTFILPKTLTAIEKRLQEDSIIGGCLLQRIDNPHPAYRFIEGFGNLRAKLTKVFYGDQGVFVRKDAFKEINGFPQVPVMEDVLFTKKMRNLGRSVVIKDKITVSARRWEKKGIIRTILFYSSLNILFWLNIPLDRLKLIYDDLR